MLSPERLAGITSYRAANNPLQSTNADVYHLLSKELAEWEVLQQQAAVLSPERQPAPDATTGPPDEAMDESAAVAAARAESHQQLTLQVRI